MVYLITKLFLKFLWKSRLCKTHVKSEIWKRRRSWPNDFVKQWVKCELLHGPESLYYLPGTIIFKDFLEHYSEQGIIYLCFIFKVSIQIVFQKINFFWRFIHAKYSGNNKLLLLLIIIVLLLWFLKCAGVIVCGCFDNG